MIEEASKGKHSDLPPSDNGMGTSAEPRGVPDPNWGLPPEPVRWPTTEGSHETISQGESLEPYLGWRAGLEIPVHCGLDRYE